MMRKRRRTVMMMVMVMIQYSNTVHCNAKNIAYFLPRQEHTQ